MSAHLSTSPLLVYRAFMDIRCTKKMEHKIALFSKLAHLLCFDIHTPCRNKTISGFERLYVKFKSQDECEKPTDWHFEQLNNPLNYDGEFCTQIPQGIKQCVSMKNHNTLTAYRLMESYRAHTTPGEWWHLFVMYTQTDTCKYTCT